MLVMYKVINTPLIVTGHVGYQIVMYIAIYVDQGPLISKKRVVEHNVGTYVVVVAS